jgi:hypothetical protein
VSAAGDGGVGEKRGEAEMSRLSTCFYGVPVKRLIPICRAKYQLGRSTMDLMAACRCKKDREYVSVAALLALEESTIRELMRDEPEKLECTLACRRELLDKLREYGIEVPTYTGSAPLLLELPTSGRGRRSD